MKIKKEKLENQEMYMERDNSRQKKLDELRKIIKNTNGLAIAFSGGTDSTLLAALAKDELGDKALAVTALSPTYPRHEQDEAGELAREIGIRHLTVESNELEIPHFSENPINRCYYCKSELFKVVKGIAEKHGIQKIADGTNTDDLNDYRPGLEAGKESGVLSPLLQAGLTKSDIREISREIGLPTADKPAFACLASRFPYGTHITKEKLTAVDAVEEKMRELEFKQFRVRHHGRMARIEVLPEDISKLCSQDMRVRIIKIAKKMGFLYVALDLEGYRTGSMNEELNTASSDVNLIQK